MGVYDFLLRQKEKWEDRLLVHQRRAFFAWAKEKGMTRGECVLLVLSDGPELYSLSERGWSREWKHRPSDVSKIIRFVFCSRGVFYTTGLSEKNWHRIFSSSLLEVWENRTYYEEKHAVLPLRLGLGQSEKEWVTGEVRRMIRDVLDGKTAELSSQYSARFDERQDLDVALWVKGRIRASVIMTGLTCKEALEIGAKRATADFRFKPITLEELPFARIEMTFMSDLIVPLTWKEYTRNEIDPTKGYTVYSEGRRGWYLPEVHNVVSFSHLQELLSKVTKEKAGIASGVAELSRYGQFEVFDWIESEGGILTLSGPTVEIEEKKLSQERIQRVATGAIEWLQSIQESDGNIPSVVSHQGVVKQLNFSALGCTGQALAYYGEVSGDEKALEIARRVYQYMQSFAPFDGLSEKKGTSHEQISALVYFLRLSFALKEPFESILLEKIVDARKQFENNPILNLQILSLLIDWERAGKGEQHRSALLEGGEQAFRECREKREKIGVQTAFYPELVAVFQGLWEITKEEMWKEKALEMSRWYVSKQFPNGSFPHSPNRSFVYTRGTGKIFEVLACFSEENKAAIEKVLTWIESMQYTKSNLFWTDERGKKWVEGGFRHDAFKSEAWIDGAAHVILGCARIYKSLK